MCVLLTLLLSPNQQHLGRPMKACPWGAIWHCMAYTHVFRSLVTYPLIVGWNGLQHALAAWTPICLASSDPIFPFSLANLPQVCWLMFHLANLSTCSVCCRGCHPASLLIHWTHTVLSALQAPPHSCWQHILVFCLPLRLRVNFCKQMSLLGNNSTNQHSHHLWLEYLYKSLFANFTPPWLLPSPSLRRQAGASRKRCRRSRMKSRRLVDGPFTEKKMI